jgi:hypothetical protein
MEVRVPIEQDPFLQRHVAGTVGNTTNFYAASAQRKDKPLVKLIHLWGHTYAYRGYYMPYLHMSEIFAKDIPFFHQVMRHQRLSSAKRPYRYVVAPAYMYDFNWTSVGNDLVVELPSWEGNPNQNQKFFLEQFQQDPVRATRDYGNPLALYGLV